MAAILSAAALFIAICVVVLHRQEDREVAAAELLPKGGEVLLPAQQFADGVARFYRYTTTNGREVRFFVVQSAAGVVHAALDSCESCYRQRRGFRQAGDRMVCNSCGRTFPTAQMKLIRDRCNPTALEYALTVEAIQVNAESLERAVTYF